MLLTSNSALLSLSLAFITTGRALKTQTTFEEDADGSFTLSRLSSDEYTTLSYPFQPDFGIRMKKAEGWCDDNVRGYTGYIDISYTHTFFQFFESRDDPDVDDIIFWLNGPLGCSSSAGMLTGLGPCTLTSNGTTKHNPHSLNSHANIFFIDQPIGLGFSYSSYEDSLAILIATFFTHFTNFHGRPMHIAGTSFGGRYVPHFGNEIFGVKLQFEEAGMQAINLRSLIIENGVVDFRNMIDSYYTTACTNVSVSPVLDIASCERMKQAVPHCKKLIQDGCTGAADSFGCDPAYSYCNEEIAMPLLCAGKYDVSGINPYDISRTCSSEELKDSSCYPIVNNISSYLSHPATHRQLGIDSIDPSAQYSTYHSFTHHNFTFCSTYTHHDFHPTQDWYRPITKDFLSGLIENGVKALVYVGNLDWRYNWIGNEEGTRHMLESEPGTLGSWEVDGKRAGLTRTDEDGMFTFVTVEGAGHLVSYDRPQEVAVMIQRWLKGEGI
ncbi:Alpha/Beta hydrolase protein [Cyathus striatus]|nr:Alpha/Beta hydrolase protein [Cyathus striatus]